MFSAVVYRKTVYRERKHLKKNTIMAFLEMIRQNNMKNSLHEINRHCIRKASKLFKKKSVKTT